MNYRVYGLVLQSELLLPDALSSTAPADVQIRFSETPERLPAATASGGWWQASPGTVLVTIPDVGRFLIRNGSEILITPSDGVSQSELSFSLMHAAIGPLLHQRNTLLLHASAVQLPSGGTVAIAGHSGSGKSTLLYECVRRGAKMVADDVAALEMGEHEGVGIHFGGALIHVWRDTLDHYGVAPDSLTQVRSMLKFQVPAPPAPATEALPLSAVAIIEPHRQPEIVCTRLSGQTAFRFLRTHARGRRIAEALNGSGSFRLLARLADRIPVFRIQRPEGDLRSLPGVADEVFSLPSK